MAYRPIARNAILQRLWVILIRKKQPEGSHGKRTAPTATSKRLLAYQGALTATYSFGHAMFGTGKTAPVFVP